MPSAFLGRIRYMVFNCRKFLAILSETILFAHSLPVWVIWLMHYFQTCNTLMKSEMCSFRSIFMPFGCFQFPCKLGEIVVINKRTNSLHLYWSINVFSFALPDFDASLLAVEPSASFWSRSNESASRLTLFAQFFIIVVCGFFFKINFFKKFFQEYHQCV